MTKDCSLHRQDDTCGADEGPRWICSNCGAMVTLATVEMVTDLYLDEFMQDVSIESLTVSLDAKGITIEKRRCV